MSRLRKNFLRNLRTFRRYARQQPSVLIVYLILRFIVIIALVLSLLNGDAESAFICILVLALFLLPAFLQDHLDVEFPSALQIIILVFIFAAEILGELSNYYVRYPYWDTVLHTTWGFLCAAVGYSLVDILNRSESIRFQLSPLFLAIVAFCFSMTIGVLWEFFEFSVDNLLEKDMQKDTVIHRFASVTLDPEMANHPIPIEDIHDVAVNGESLGVDGYLDIGLYDTMEDLFVNFIGALTFSLVGFFDARGKGGGHLTTSLVPRYRKNGQPPDDDD